MYLHYKTSSNNNRHSFSKISWKLHALKQSSEKINLVPLCVCVCEGERLPKEIICYDEYTQYKVESECCMVRMNGKFIKLFLRRFKDP